MMPAKARYGKEAWGRLYKLKGWQNPRRGLRMRVLARDDFTCTTCQRVEHASRLHAHHVIPHKGDEELFWNENNIIALCEDCHRIHTAETEVQGYLDAVDDLGLPIDQNHPFNRKRK